MPVLLEAHQGRPHFSLFLRPFTVTGKISIKNPFASSTLWPTTFSEPRIIDLEEMLAQVFSNEAPLLGFGRPGEAIGAGRALVTDQEWKREIAKWMFFAELILIVPASSEGSEWEIRFIKEQNLLEKCIFVIPPDLLSLLATKALRMELLPIKVPPYDEKGSLYTVNSNGDILSVESLKVTTTNDLSSRIEKLAARVPHTPLAFTVADQPVVRLLGALTLPLILLIAVLFFTIVLVLML